MVFAWEVLQICLVPCLVPLGSAWFHHAQDVLFAALWLGSCLVPLGSYTETIGFYSFLAWFCLVPVARTYGFRDGLKEAP